MGKYFMITYKVSELSSPLLSLVVLGKPQVPERLYRVTIDQGLRLIDVLAVVIPALEDCREVLGGSKVGEL